MENNNIASHLNATFNQNESNHANSFSNKPINESINEGEKCVRAKPNDRDSLSNKEREKMKLKKVGEAKNENEETKRKEENPSENINNITPLEKFFGFLNNLNYNKESKDGLSNICENYLKYLEKSELKCEDFKKDMDFLKSMALKYLLIFRDFPGQEYIKEILTYINKSASDNQKLLIAQVFHENTNLKFLSIEEENKLLIQFFRQKVEETESECEISQKKNFNIFQGDIFHKIFNELKQISNENSDLLTQSLKERKIKKNLFNGKLSHSIVVSEKGGFYALLNFLSRDEWNSLSIKMKEFLFHTQINYLTSLLCISSKREKYLKKQFFGKLQNEDLFEIGTQGRFYQFLIQINKDAKTKGLNENDKKIIESYIEKEENNNRKIVLGEGTDGKVRLSLCILKPDYFSLQSSEIFVGEINCVKKFIQTEEEKKKNQNLLIKTWSHFSSEQFGKYFLPIFDISLNLGLKTVYKGYVIQKILNFKCIEDLELNDKNHYFICCCKAAKHLLYKLEIAMTDFCTKNILYDETSKRAYVIDLSKSPKVEKNSQGFYMSKIYGGYHSIETEVEELIEKKQEINMEKAYIFLLNEIWRSLFNNKKDLPPLLKKMQEKYSERTITLKQICSEVEKIFDLTSEIQIENYMKGIQSLIFEERDPEFMKLLGLNKEIIHLDQQIVASDQDIITWKENQKWLTKRYVCDKYGISDNTEKEEINKSLNNFINTNENNKKAYILLGDAGFGKSMILKLFYLSLIRNPIKNQNGKLKIPIFLYLGKSVTIEQQWEKIMSYLEIKGKIQIKFPFNNKFPKIYLIDAFDEARINYPFVKFFLYNNNITHSSQLIITSRSWYHFNNKSLIFIMDYYKNIKTIKFLNKFEDDYIKNALGENNFKTIKRNALLEYAKIPYLFYIISNLPEEYKKDLRITRYDIIQQNINEKIKLNEKFEENILINKNIVNDLAREIYQNEKQKHQLDENESLNFLKKYDYENSKALKDQHIFNLLNEINPDLDINHLSFDHILSQYVVVIQIMCDELIHEIPNEIHALHQDKLIFKRALSQYDYEFIRLFAEHIQKNEVLGEKLCGILKKSIQSINNYMKYDEDLNKKIGFLLSNVATLLNASSFTFFKLDLFQISKYLVNAMLRDAIFIKCTIDKKQFSKELTAYAKTQNSREHCFDLDLPFQIGSLKEKIKIDQIYRCNSRDLIIFLGNSKIMYFSLNFQSESVGEKYLPFFPESCSVKCFDVFVEDPKKIHILLGCSNSKNFEIKRYTAEYKKNLNENDELEFYFLHNIEINEEFKDIFFITHSNENNFASLHPKFILIWNLNQGLTARLENKNAKKLIECKKMFFHPKQPNVLFSGVYQFENQYFIQSWDISTQQSLKTITMANEIKFFDISLDGKIYLLKADKDCYFLYSFYEMKQLQKIALNQSKSFSLSENCEYICLISDRKIAIRQTDDLEIVFREYEMTKAESAIKHESSLFLDLNDQKRIMIATNMGTIRISENFTSFMLKTYEGFSRKVTSLCFSPFQEKFILAGSDHEIKLFDRENGRMLRKEFFSNLSIEQVGFSKTEEYIFLVGRDEKYKSIIILSFPDFEIKYNEEFFNITFVTFLPKNTLVFCVYDKGGNYIINLLDLVTLKKVKEINCQSEVSFGKLINDDLILIQKTSSFDFCVLTLEINKLRQTIRKIKRKFDLKNRVFEIIDQDYIISGAENGVMAIWTKNEFQFEMEVNFPCEEKDRKKAHLAAITSLNLCANNLLVSGSEDKTIKIWRFEFKQEGKYEMKYIYLYLSATLQAHQDSISCVCFSNDGRYIVSGSHDRNILVWKEIENDQNNQFEWVLFKVISSGETLLKPEITYNNI